MAKKVKKKDRPLIDVILEMAFKHAERVLLKTDAAAQLVPVFATFKDGDVDIIATPWNNDEQKRQAQMLIRAKLIMEKCDAYSFVSEAWMLAVNKSEFPNAEDYDGIMPSQSERRIEVVVATAVAKSETGLDKRFSTWAIIRNDQGVIVELKPMKEPYQGADSVGGTMPSLMDDL